jgi:uncharacterized Fe-S cluster protein YjdI
LADFAHDDQPFLATYIIVFSNLTEDKISYMKDITKKYSNGEVTIVWKPAVCIHSTICWKAATGLPGVFNPLEKPWIKPEASTTGAIIEQVKKCPSGALSFYMNDEG